LEKHFVVFNDRKIEFDLVRKKVKNINLRTRSDLSVMVSANNRVPVDLIKDFVSKKAQWILMNQEKYIKNRRLTSDKKEYINGEVFFLLGRQLKLNITAAKEESVCTNTDILEVHTKKCENITRIRNLVGKYYLGMIENVYSDSLKRTVKMLGMNFVPDMKIRRMISRWGSCAVTKKRIAMNSALICTALQCIDYVMMHELLHFRYPGHNKSFYDNLTANMPDWKERKKALNNTSIRELML
jgi:predicted metal-dependent hydrolase